VCVDVPRLSLDRPFTYRLRDGDDAGVGSLVSVRFHGRTVRAWVLGPASEPLPERLLAISRVRSPVRFFDERMLELLRWVSRRYVAPLSTVIARSHPPRVAGLEATTLDGLTPARPSASGRGPWTLPEPGSVTWVRPLPGHEGEECVRGVAACLAAGRSALVLVPEAEPVPATARAALDAFPDRVVLLLGGTPRARYRAWLAARGGEAPIVVGTRPAIFAPLPGLGLIWISREAHTAHREDRAPYYHVRDVGAARASLEGAACVLASLAPSVETAVAVSEGRWRSVRPDRTRERSAAPLVETTPPGAEDRSPRLGRLVRAARSGALIVSRPGYGVARVCRTCGQPAACAVCRGVIVLEGGRPLCRVCGAPGRCATCGGDRFGVERGGAERVAEWAAGLAPVPVVGAGPEDGTPEPGGNRIVVGGPELVADALPPPLELVGLLDPDRALARPGLRAGEQALATWMEAAAWAGPRDGAGRVLVQTRYPGHPAVQALVRWEPESFLLREARARAEAGFPPGHPVFRVIGSPALSEAMAAAPGPPRVIGVPGPEGRTVCLVTIRPEDLAAFREHVVGLAVDGTVERVEAEPHL
jgi:primosomal protein N' (replication factor Y)